MNIRAITKTVVTIAAALLLAVLVNALLTHLFPPSDGLVYASLIGFRPKPLTLAELMSIVNPEQARQPEVVPAILFSERTYVSATTLNLSFYDTNQSDPTLDNVSNGQLPAPQFFQQQQHFIDIMGPVTSSAGVIAGGFNDVELLTKVGRGLAVHLISRKEYLRYRILAAGAIGGTTGVINGSYTAPIDLQAGNNGVPGHSPYQVNGMVVIPPQTDFSYSIAWQAAQTLSANKQIMISMYGALYRRVL